MFADAQFRSRRGFVGILYCVLATPVANANVSVSAPQQPGTTFETEQARRTETFDWAKLRDQLFAGPNGAWILERYHGVKTCSPAEAPARLAHLQRLHLLWEPETELDRAWLAANGFDDPSKPAQHPLLRPHDAWSTRATEYLTRCQSGQIHILFEPGMGTTPGEERRTVQYRHDGLVVEQVSQGSLSSATRIFSEGSVGDHKVSFGGMAPAASADFIVSMGCLLSLERMVRKLDLLLGDGHIGDSREKWAFEPGSIEGRISLMAPSDRDQFGVANLPYGFELIPGHVRILIGTGPGLASGRIRLQWIDALDCLYSEDRLEWRDDGGFEVRSTSYYPGSEDVAILDVATSIPDKMATAIKRPCRWVPKIGEFVDDRRGEASVRYKVGVSGKIPSLTELVEATIYEGGAAQGTHVSLPHHDVLAVGRAIEISSERGSSVLELGELPYGNTPVRIPFFNEHDEYMGIVDLHSDCGCIDVHTDVSSVDPGGICHLNGTVAVRTAGQVERAVRVGFVVGASGEVKYHTVRLRYKGVGSLAVQPEQTYVGVQVAGSTAEVDLRVLLPGNSSPDDLDVSISGSGLPYKVTKSGAAGQHWIRVTVPIPMSSIGAVDLPLSISFEGVSAISTVSCSVAPNRELAKDWPVWRIPLSRVGSHEIRFGALEELGLKLGEEIEGLVVWELSSKHGIGIRLREGAQLNGRVRTLTIDTRLGPLRILLK